MKNVTIDMAVKSENLNSNSMLRLYKQNLTLKLMEIKGNEPRLTQKQICQQLGFSDSTFNRYRNDISVDSPSRRKQYRKKNTSKTQSQIHTTSETPKQNKKY